MQNTSNEWPDFQQVPDYSLVDDYRRTKSKPEDIVVIPPKYRRREHTWTDEMLCREDQAQGKRREVTKLKKSLLRR